MTQKNHTSAATLPTDAIGPFVSDASVGVRIQRSEDGLVLEGLSLFSPTQGRGALGARSTRRLGDVVTIASPSVGALVNTVQSSDAPQTGTRGAVLQRLRGGRVPAN